MVESSNAKKFWSEKAKNYPGSLILSGGEIWGPGVAQRKGIGEKIRESGWIPAQGPILDLGAGNCTKYILGDELAGNGQTWAVDFSPVLLEDGGVREDRRIVDDVTKMSFPVVWEKQFSLVYSSLFFRYITTPQRIELINKIGPILAPGGRLVIIDFSKIQNAKISQELGEAEVFNSKETAKILLKAGFNDVQSGTWNMEFYFGGDPTPFSVDFVSGVK